MAADAQKNAIAFQSSLTLLIVILSCFDLLFGVADDTNASQTFNPSFSSPEQERAVYNFLQIHREWRQDTLGALYNPWCIGGTEWTDSMQTGRKNALIGIEPNRQHLEDYFGKEFFAELLQYHQNALDATEKYVQKDFKSARAYWRKANKNAKKLKRLAMKHNGCVSHLFVQKLLVESLLGMGITDRLRGKAKAGMKTLYAAYHEASRVKWRKGKAAIAYCVAQSAVWLNQGNGQWFNSTIPILLYQNALDIARKNQSHYFIWRGCESLAWFYLQQGYLESARDRLKEAIISIDFMRTKMEEDGRRVNYFCDKSTTYLSLAGILMELGEAREALEVCENVKARVLQDLLDSAGNLKLSGAGHEILLRQEEELAEMIDDLEVAQGNEAKERLDALKQAHANIVARIREDNPDFGMMKIGGTLDIEEIQALLDENTVLLEYNLVEFRGQHLYAWLISKSSLLAIKIPLDTSGLADKVKAIRMMINKPKVPTVNKLLAQFYAITMAPFEKMLEGKNLIVVPHGALHSLPFAALMDSRGKFLVETHSLWLVPSANVLKLCLAKKKDGAAQSILALGNPDLGDPKMDLPNAEREVKSIANKFPQAKAYMRQEATETLAKNIIGDFDIIHFACHGEIVEGGGFVWSSLRLAGDDQNDGNLTVGEIFDLKLKAQLVTLSGCETGRGETYGSDEFMGFMRSFLVAGTPSVIVSHWKVDDDATSLLMTHFYENLAAMGKAEALRMAQIQTMKTKKHPYYWAAFYLVGDGR